jgi:hypothetical protein
MLVTKRPSAVAAMMLLGKEKKVSQSVSHGIFDSPLLQLTRANTRSDSQRRNEEIYSTTRSIHGPRRGREPETDGERERGGDSYTAAEGAEGAAADIAAVGFLERRRRLHGFRFGCGGGSGPELVLLASLRRSDPSQTRAGEGEEEVGERDREGQGHTVTASTSGSTAQSCSPQRLHRPRKIKRLPGFVSFPSVFPQFFSKKISVEIDTVKTETEFLISIVKIGDNSQTCIKVSNYQSHVGSSPANKHTARNYSFNIPKGIANVLPNL